MKQSNRIITVLAFILLKVTCLFSEQYLLQNINITGLKRTKYQTILNITNLKPGIFVDETIEEDVKQTLLETGIFQNDIKVELEILDENKGNINITIQDRWTLIPIPVGFVSSDSWLAGGIFIESNLGGLNQQLVSGVFAQSDSTLGFASWKIPTFLGSLYNFGLTTSFYSGLKEHIDVTGEITLASQDEVNLNISAQLGRSYKNGINWNFKTGFELLETENSTNYLNDISDYYFVNNMDLGWDNLYFSSFFQKGWDINISTKLLTNFNDSEISPLLELKISNNILIKENLLKFFISSGIHNSNNSYPIFIGGTDGSKALSSDNVPTKSYVNGSLLFEPVIIKPSWGMFTLPVYYEGGIYKDLTEDKNIFWHGPGIGFKFYIDKVAIPALGADFTWDLEHNTFKVVVSLGGTGGGN